MAKNFFFSIIILCLAVPAGLYAQQTSSGNGDFPHVSQINVEVRNNLIRLTWVDSPDAIGPVYIFRSVRPFFGAIPANIRPVVIRYGTQFYIDDTDDMGNLYYFIAASDVSGLRYDVIIPRINSANVNLSQPDAPITPALPSIAVREPAEGISNLRAVLDGDKVTVTYNNTNPQRNTILYRSTQPLRRPSDLLNAAFVQSGMDMVEDFPVPGISWYYAVIYEDEIASGNMRIIPGVNSTVTAIIISPGQTARYMRPMPLPALMMHNVPGGFLTDNTRHIPLSIETIDMINNTLMPQGELLQYKRPRVFTIDLQAPAGGEESALFQIIKEHFEKFDWERARESLQHFLALPRSREVEARARFYLGQTLYFTGNYRDALLEFLAFRYYHQVEANIWIDAVLAAMVQ